MDTFYRSASMASPKSYQTCVGRIYLYIHCARMIIPPPNFEHTLYRVVKSHASMLLLKKGLRFVVLPIIHTAEQLRGKLPTIHRIPGKLFLKATFSYFPRNSQIAMDRFVPRFVKDIMNAVRNYLRPTPQERKKQQEKALAPKKISGQYRVQKQVPRPRRLSKAPSKIQLTEMS